MPHHSTHRFLALVLAIGGWSIPLVESGTTSLNHRCSVTTECGRFAECHQSECRCLDGFGGARNSIDCHRVLLGKCHTDSECGPGAECPPEHRRCLCRPGYRESFGNWCEYAKKPLGAMCRTDTDCGIEAVCVDQQCQCYGFNVPEPNQIDCRPNRTKLEHQCNPKFDECGEFAVCRDEVCQCLRGFTAAGNQVNCIQTDQIRCVNSEECGRFAICTTNGTCVCQPGSARIGGQCSPVLTTLEHTIVLLGLVIFGLTVILLFSLAERFTERRRPKKETVDCPLLEVPPAESVQTDSTESTQT